VGPNTTELRGQTSWTSDGNYAAVIIKASTSYMLHVNVTTGSVLPTVFSTRTGKHKDISHVSRFVCQ
jgi:hypothetical protein